MTERDHARRPEPPAGAAIVRCALTCCVIACSAFLACGGTAPTGNDVTIIPPDQVADWGGDAAEPDATDIRGYDATAPRDNSRDMHYNDLNGIDFAAVGCETDDDCPQSGRPCEHVSCRTQDGVCVQNNSAVSGDMCDEGYRCRKDGRCSGGVCIYAAVECADCGDGVCFNAGENCRDCKADCGECPAHESDCADGLDDDVDGTTDCDDLEDCSEDARCGDWKCISYTPDGTVACGQAVSGEPIGMPFYPDVTACDQVPSDWALLYEFPAVTNSSVTIRLTPEDKTEKFRIFVLEGQCNPAYCIGYSAPNGAMTFDARAGWTYYLVVNLVSDGMGGVTADVTCD